MAAETRPDHPETALRSRTYPGDYQHVWAAAERALAQVIAGSVVEAAPEKGLLVASSSGLGTRRRVELELVELETGEVQVDGRAEATPRLADLGGSRRALAGVLAELDRKLDGR